MFLLSWFRFLLRFLTRFIQIVLQKLIFPTTLPGELIPFPNLFEGSFTGPVFEGPTKAKALGYLYYVWSGWKPVIIIADPKAAKEFYGTEQALHGRDFGYLGSVFSRLMRHSLGYAKGADWLRLHKVFAPAFRKPEAESDMVQESVRKWISQLKAKMTVSETNVMKLPLRILSTLLYGALYTDQHWLEINHLMNLHNQLVKDMNCFWTKVPSFSYWPHPINKRVTNFKQRWLNFNKRYYELVLNAKTPNTCIFAQVCLNKLITFDELLDTMYELLLFNIEISGSSLSLNLLTIAEHPRIQEKLRSELSQEMDCNPNYAKLNEFPYLDHVVRECGRLHPGLSVSFAEQTHKMMVLNGHLLPKGVYVSIDANTLNRNPNVWEKPEECIPERFEFIDMKSGEDKWKMHTFGLGARQCLGRHYATLIIKLVLYHSVTNFKSISIFDGDKQTKRTEGIAMLQNSDVSDVVLSFS